MKKNPTHVLAEVADAPAPKPCADCIRVNALLGLSKGREDDLKAKHDRVVKMAVGLIGGACEEHDEIAINMGLGDFIEAYPKGCMWCLQRSLAIANASISMLQQAVLDAREHKDGHKCQALIHMTDKRDLLRHQLLEAETKIEALEAKNSLNQESLRRLREVEAKTQHERG
jgi:hypothetical protein